MQKPREEAETELAEMTLIKSAKFFEIIAYF